MKPFHQIITAALLLCTTAFTTACSMMEEDRSDCPTGLYVNFVYDYNTQRADMFKDHVGYVTVYVFDENGNKVAEKSISNAVATMPLMTYGYTMHFSTDELPAGHQYRLQAVAMQKDWNEALSTKGAKYRRTQVTDANSLIISLDHDVAPLEAASVKGMHAVSNVAPLDTLWHTLKVIASEPQYGYTKPGPQKTTKPYSVYPLEEQMVKVQEGYATYATISLIRDTKHLNVTLHQIDNPEDIYAEDYEVTIVDNNAVLASDNSLLASDSLLYMPYAQWTTTFGEDGLGIEGDPAPAPLPKKAPAKVIERSAHYDIMFNRLMYKSPSENSAMLRIRNVNTGDVVAYINLPYMLADGRLAWELYNWGPQEYLDREYDYRLDLFLKGDQWKYLDIKVHVLAWSLRRQNTVL